MYRDEFADFPAFLAAVMAAGVNRYDAPDSRLEFAAAATGSGETVPSDGGFLVPTEFAADLWQKVYDTGQILERCDRQPVTIGNKLKIPAIDETSRVDASRFGAVQMSWIAEGATATASRPKYRQIILSPKKLLGLTYVTAELLADVPALARWLERVFSAEAAFTIEDEVINGNGGRLLGVLSSPALLTVAKDVGQLASTVVAANFKSLFNRCWGASRARAAWLIQPDVWDQIAEEQLQIGQPLITYSATGEPLIFGRPVLQLEQMPALGGVGDVVLADLSQYLLAEIAPDFLSSIHVQFLQDEEVFKFRWRLDGAPAWSSPITPLNSTTTQSPFVTLAARA